MRERESEREKERNRVLNNIHRERQKGATITIFY